MLSIHSFVALAAAGLFFFPLSKESRAFSMSPMILEDESGIVQVANKSKRSIQVDVKVFPVVTIDGKETAALEPLPENEIQRLIRFRPHGARVRSSSTRNIAYTILNESASFYLCASTRLDTLLLRICSARRPLQ